MLGELREHVLSKLCSVIITVLNTLPVARTEVPSNMGSTMCLSSTALNMQVTIFTARQEVLCRLFAAEPNKQAHGSTPFAETAAGLLSLCLTLLASAAAMSAVLRRSVTEHLLPAAMSLSRTAHAIFVSNTGLQQQHRTGMLVFMAVCSSRCVCHVGPRCLTGL